MVFGRATFSVIYLVLMINVKAKRIFYEEMGKKDILPMILRSIQSTASSIINIVAVKYIDIIIIALLNNTTPLFVCLLAMCFLKERLRIVEVFFMSLTFVAVIVIICGQKPSGSSSTFKQAPVVYLLLFINPVLQASG